jgi:hypothetical protein
LYGQNVRSSASVVAEDPVVLLVEPVHRPPRERDLAGQQRRVLGQRDVLPRAARGALVAADDLEPRGLAQVAVHGPVVGRAQRAVGEVGDREVRDRIAPRLEQQDGVVAVDDGAPAELGPQAAPQRLGVQHPLRHAGHEELPVRVAAQRTLLP